MKKFLLTIFASLVLFFSFASQLSVNAQIINGQNLSGGCVSVPSNQSDCTGSQTVACMQPVSAGNIRRWCCDTQASCDAAKGVVQEQISNQLASPTSSQATAWYNTSFPDWFGKVYDPNNPSEIFGERYTAAQVQWVIYSIFSSLISGAVGPQNMGLVQCFLNNVADISTCAGQLSGLVDATARVGLAQQKTQDKNLWQLVFATDRPLSGISYTKERIENFNLIPTAHAQTIGFGFRALEPVQSMWTGVRDISFGLFVIAAIVLAFMIMFRVKISPQVVISVQSAIPKIIIALVLVTFSYAIAGFLVDLMYVVIGLVSLLAPSISVINISAPDLFTFLTASNIFLVLVAYLFSLVLGFILMFIMMIGGLLTVGIGAFIAAAVGGTGGVVGILLLIIIAVLVVVALWAMLKVVWTLLKALASVLLLTIFAPLEITAGVVIPSLGFGTWLKSFVSALSTFVVTGVLMLLSIIFLINGVGLGFQGFAGGPAGFDLGRFFLSLFFGSEVSSLVAGDVVRGWPPLLGGTSQSVIGVMFLGVSFVLFTMIPRASELIQSILSGKPFAYGTSIGELTGPAGSLYAGYASNQLLGGATPAPFNRIPGLTNLINTQWSPDQRKQLAEGIQNFFRTRR
jgi:hypothetical protein